MTDGRTRRVFLEMLREEWRLHSRLFRGGHFALFPAFIALVTAGAVGLLVVTGPGAGAAFAGLHGLAFVVGLHTGSIGLVGRDALRNLLGDLTLIVFSARTLPLSRSRLLGVFVVKDLVYYAALFLLPMALGATVTARWAPEIPGVVTLAVAVFLLWTTLTMSFVLGMGVTIAALGITRRGVPGAAILVALAASVATAWVGGIDVLAYTPYGVFLAQTAPRIAAAAGLVLGTLLLGAVTFDPTMPEPARVVGPSFRRWWRRTGDPLAAKTLLDVHRSSGGFGKVLFSAAILFGVTASLVDLAGRITGASPSVGISFGAVLGLSGFTTYNWLTQTDDVDSYLVHPLAVTDVFAAKFRAFLLLGPPVGLVFYAAGLAWRGAPPLEAAVGAALLVGVACYIFGATVYLTGLSPNEFLFDTPLFAAFTLAMAVPLVPVLVAAFALSPASVTLLAALGTVAIALALVGVALYRRSLPKWSRRYRRA